MFLENDYARPLFDFEKGGPPKAYQCLCLIDYDNHKLHKILGRSGKHPCGKVTRTERGMRMHLKIVHDWKEQPCLSSMEECKTEPGAPRKLRAGAPNLNQQGEKEMSKATAKKAQPKQKSQETNESGLLNFTSEENTSSSPKTQDGSKSATVTSTEQTPDSSDTAGTGTK